jgi:hypothetical protein
MVLSPDVSVYRANDFPSGSSEDDCNAKSQVGSGQTRRHRQRNDEFSEALEIAERHTRPWRGKL